MEPLAYRLSARGGFTTDCEAALDQRFLDQPPAAMPLEGSLTWRQVFSSPRHAREKAGQAMGRGCADVERDCDPAALAAFAALKYQCGGRRYAMLRHIGPGIHEVFEQAGLDQLADNTVYWRRRGEVEKAYYRTAWLAAKCHALPRGALTSFVPEGRRSAFPPPIRGLPSAIDNATRTAHDPRPGEEGWWWAEQAWEAHQLMGRAHALDRRGGRRFRWVGYQYGPLDHGSWQSQDPLVAEIIQLKRDGKVMDREQHRMSRVLHAYLAVIYADAQGAALDRKWLSAQIGLPVSEDEWDQAAVRAERLLRAQGRRVLFVDQPTDDG